MGFCFEKMSLFEFFFKTNMGDFAQWDPFQHGILLVNMGFVEFFLVIFDFESIQLEK